MTNTIASFLQIVFIKVYNDDIPMWRYLSSEENILFMHDHIFGKMITIDEIEEVAQIVGDDRMAKILAESFVIESNKIENIFHKALKVIRELKARGI